MTSPRLGTGASSSLYPGYVHAIGVGQGTVVGAGEVLCCLLPGAAGFSVREVTTETGDFEAVAVEPRRSGRIALAGLDSVTVEDGGPAAECAMAASPDSSLKLSENDGSPDVATPSWDGMLRSAGLRSDPMRMGWIVAFALLLTLGLAICTRDQDATPLSGEPVASADAGYGSEVRG